jgi:hypothetical protein
VVLGWRENFNAHGFGVGTFYLKAPKGRTLTGFQNDGAFELVTVWDDITGPKALFQLAHRAVQTAFYTTFVCWSQLSTSHRYWCWLIARWEKRLLMRNV